MRRFFFNANHLVSQGLITEQNHSNLNNFSTSGFDPDSSTNAKSSNNSYNNNTSIAENKRETKVDIVEQHSNAFPSLITLPTDTILTLPDDIYHHWCRVLRAKVGDKSTLFDGLGGETIIELVSIDKKKATARILSNNKEDNTPLFYSTIAIVMSRGDRMDYAIQKSTELGVTFIQLLTSQFGEVKLKTNQVDKKLNHWQQVALSASEQCGLNRPPIVLSPVSIEDWLQTKCGNPHDSISYLLSDPFYQYHERQEPLPLVLAVPNQEERHLLDVDKKINENFSSNSSQETKSHKTKSNKTKSNETNSNGILSNGSKLDFTKPRFDILIGAEGGLSETEYQQSRQSGYLPWQLGNRVLRTETAPVVALSTLLYISGLYNNS